MKEAYKILKRMEHCPAMWTGELGLKSIRTFIDGYRFALSERQVTFLDQDFNDWVAHKLGFGESTAGWQNMILAVTLGLHPKTLKWENYDADVTKEQHEKSISKFYELLEEYMTDADQANQSVNRN